MKFKRVYIEITNVCNKNCSFCSTRKLPKKEMNVLEIEHVFKEVKKVADHICIHVKGEPLMHSEFSTVLKLADKYKLMINLTTNGTFLDKYIDEITSSTVRQLNISMQDYTNNIIESVETILSKNNSINIVYRYWGLEKEIDKLISYYNYDGEIISNFKLKNRLYVNKHGLFVWPNLDHDYISEKGFCYGLKTHIGILSNGTVVPCCLDCDGIISLGNIFDNSIEEIISNERVKNIIKSFEDGKKIEELCKRCNNSIMME